MDYRTHEFRLPVELPRAEGLAAGALAERLVVDARMEQVPVGRRVYDARLLARRGDRGQESWQEELCEVEVALRRGLSTWGRIA